MTNFLLFIIFVGLMTFLGAILKELHRIAGALEWMRARQEREEQHMIPPKEWQK